MNQQNIGNTIHNARQKSGKSKKELSEITGFSDRAITYWENGERSISAVNLNKLLNALNASITLGIKEKAAL